MKTSNNSQCHFCDHAAHGQCSEPRSEGRIRLLINAASAARGGPARMSLSDWRELEREVNERLQNENTKQ